MYLSFVSRQHYHVTAWRLIMLKKFSLLSWYARIRLVLENRKKSHEISLWDWYYFSFDLQLSIQITEYLNSWVFTQLLIYAARNLRNWVFTQCCVFTQQGMHASKLFMFVRKTVIVKFSNFPPRNPVTLYALC